MGWVEKWTYFSWWLLAVTYIFGGPMGVRSGPTFVGGVWRFLAATYFCWRSLAVVAFCRKTHVFEGPTFVGGPMGR